MGGVEGLGGGCRYLGLDGLSGWMGDRLGVDEILERGLGGWVDGLDPIALRWVG